MYTANLCKQSASKGQKIAEFLVWEYFDFLGYTNVGLSLQGKIGFFKLTIKYLITAQSTSVYKHT